jgi:hypothetical protein
MAVDFRWLWPCLLPLAAGCTQPIAAERAAEDIPAVRKAQCRWRTDRITIDGILDEKAWEKAEKLTDFAVFWQKRKPDTATTARLLWDDEYFYFCAEMVDHDLFALEKEHNGRTWEDDVFEIFLKPAADKRPYYEFQVNPLNTRLELFLPSRGAGGYRRFADEARLGMQTAVKLRGTLNDWEDKDVGWTVEGRIPWTAFKPTGGPPKPGEKWRFALCRYDYSVYLERPELSSTAPLTEPDFHRYEDYGELTFVGR